jgi:hypothetical protein
MLSIRPKHHTLTDLAFAKGGVAVSRCSDQQLLSGRLRNAIVESSYDEVAQSATLYQFSWHIGPPLSCDARPIV